MRQILCTLVAMAAISTSAHAKNPWVGGGEMFPERDIIDNAVNSKDHTTLVTAVKAAGLVPTLKSKGPFTVFAPTNEAFSRLPAGTVESLLEAKNKPKLKKILTYHVLSGRMDANAIRKKIRMGNGRAILNTVSGNKLIATMKNKKLYLTDEKGSWARITIANVPQKNGIIHVINRVVLPN